METTKDSLTRLIADIQAELQRTAQAQQEIQLALQELTQAIQLTKGE